MEKPESQESLAATQAAWEVLPADYRQRFSGIGRLYGLRAALQFSQSTVTIIGVGGVGSWVVESLARSGIGRLRLIDLDDVCTTNVNRQLPALDGEIGKAKIDVLAERCRKINPSIRLELHHAFVSAENLTTFLPLPHCGVVVDCIDRAFTKAAILAYAKANAIPCVTVGGAGGRLDATAIRVDDLTKTHGDPLLKQLRKSLKKNYQLPRFPGKKLGIPCVFSTEPLRFPTEAGSCSPTPEPGTSLRMDCASGYGAATHLTGTFGFAAAGTVLKLLSGEAVSG